MQDYNIITSRANSAVAEAASLAEKKHRDRLGLFLCEGVKLFCEAVASGAEVERVFVTREAADEPAVSELLDKLPFGAVNIVTKSVLDRISTEKAPQGVICAVRYLDKLHKNITIYNNTIRGEDLLPRRALLLDGVGDPGNLGTIIRTAAALGMGELIAGPGCADIYNPRAVRASMGSLFRQRITRVERMADSVTALRALGAEVWAATLGAERTVDELFEHGRGRPVYVIIGNEGHGVSAEVAAAADGTVTIPITDGAESLNAAVAAAIFIWAGRER